MRNYLKMRTFAKINEHPHVPTEKNTTDYRGAAKRERDCSFQHLLFRRPFHFNLRWSFFYPADTVKTD